MLFTAQGHTAEGVVIEGWAPVFPWRWEVHHFLIHKKGLPGLCWVRPAAVK